jgi:hypothetical protein
MANKVQIFWMWSSYWKRRHVNFLTIAVDRGGQFELVSGVSMLINIFRCSHVLNFRFVNGKLPWGTGVPIFCIISISIRIYSHSPWQMEQMSVVFHLTASWSRSSSHCTLITWSWEVMTVFCSRSPLFFATCTSMALVTPSTKDSWPVTAIALTMPWDNMMMICCLVLQWCY